MAKRFIDTGLFDDAWFMELSLSGKILWIFCITKCDHAGILEMNERLCQFQTGIKGLETVIKELGNRLISVKDGYYFIPKFIEFQYPNFPNSKVRQQESAIKILKEFELFDEINETVSKGLVNSYDSGNDNGNDNVSENVVNIEFDVFWNLYDKKVGNKEKCLKKWNKLKDEQRQKIIETLPIFKAATNDKQFRPFPETYLNNNRWEDEIEIDKTKLLDENGYQRFPPTEMVY